MILRYELLLFAVCLIKVSFCQTKEINSTSTINSNRTLSSRREVLERQAHNAYINACLRLQELANWMSVVLKIKTVWASASVNKFSAKSTRALSEADQRSLRTLPPRPKINGSECSVKSVQVTVKTYAHLQSQLLILKRIFGRNIVQSSKEKIDDVNSSVMEKMKTLDIFNNTLNGIIGKLKQSTQELSSQVNSEGWKSLNIFQNIQEGRFLQYLPDPRSFLGIQEGKEQGSLSVSQGETRNFFQNFGRTLDRILFSTVAPELSVTGSN